MFWLLLLVLLSIRLVGEPLLIILLVLPLRRTSYSPEDNRCPSKSITGSEKLPLSDGATPDLILPSLLLPLPPLFLEEEELL